MALSMVAAAVCAPAAAALGQLMEADRNLAPDRCRCLELRKRHKWPRRAGRPGAGVLKLQSLDLGQNLFDARSATAATLDFARFPSQKVFFRMHSLATVQCWGFCRLLLSAHSFQTHAHGFVTRNSRRKGVVFLSFFLSVHRAHPRAALLLS